MRLSKPTDFGLDLVKFFEDYLPEQRGMSPHTIHSYRDTFMLLLQFLVRDTNRAVEKLEINDFTAEHVLAFLSYLEKERKNGVATRNARLGAIHVFARFVASHRPELLGTLQRVIGLPFKRGVQESPIDYLERPEIEALLQSIDRRNILGRRDYALFAFMFNTGARVQEVLDLCYRDIRLDSPSQVRLQGKGGKSRLCPIWPATVGLLRDMMSEVRSIEQDPLKAFVFTNARGKQMTRYGVRYLLRKYVAVASCVVPTLRNKRIHPHSLRHSTAIALLKAGVDFATISQWLGHANLNTTMRYARADVDLKRQAISQVFPDMLAPPRGGHLLVDGKELLGWLRRI